MKPLLYYGDKAIKWSGKALKVTSIAKVIPDEGILDITSERAELGSIWLYVEDFYYQS